MASNLLLGVGLRELHVQEVLTQKPTLDWFEVHSENYLNEGDPAFVRLLQVRQDYPISLHGIGLSLASSDGVCLLHLSRLKKLIQKINPFLVSEHLSWSRIGNTVMPDLLPVPYTQQALDIVVENVQQSQELLGQTLLIENPSSYLQYQDSHLAEVDFLVELCQRTGAQILLDVNNIFVSCSNHGWDAKQYIERIPTTLVREFHLAGHSIKTLKDGSIIRIDTHDDYVCQEVWSLYKLAVQRFGKQPTLLEWDASIPPLDELITEARKATVLVNALEGQQDVHA